MKIKNFFSFLLLLAIQPLGLNCVIIIVHGTFSTNHPWCHPGGDFYEPIEKRAKELNQKVVPFTWNGKNNESARIIAAESFASLVLSYSKEEEIIVIGHSHGANIIGLASKLLNDPIAKLAAQIKRNIKSSKNEFSEKLKDFLIFKNCKNNQTWLAALINIHQLLKSKSKVRSFTKNYLIKAAYFLAAPVDEKSYLPDMEVIEKLYNFYSLGDGIQPVFGLYKRSYSQLERIINFRLTIANSGWFCDHPTHTQMHHPLLAKWLLDIPENLVDQKLFGFENYTDQFDGIIHINETGTISYEQDKSSTADKKENQNSQVTSLPAGNSYSLEL